MHNLFLSIITAMAFGFSVNAQWIQIGNDIDGEAIDDLSGWSVSLSNDGATVAIGAIVNDGSGTDAGHVRVFQDSNGVWTQTGVDIDGETEYSWSGYSVSLSGDGSKVAIGAPWNNGSGYAAGHVRVYQNTGGIWTQVGADIDGEAANDRSGISVSLSSDGTTVAIGAPNNDANGINAGHVRVYQDNSGVWTQVGADIDGEAASDSSGVSVSLSSDGTTVAIGAPRNNGGGYAAGHVRVYQNTGGIWTQVGADIDGEAAGDWSGWSVSLSGDGSVVAIGALVNDGNGSDAGHVRIYQDSGGIWTQVGVDIDGEATYDYSGFSVSLNNDGTTVAIGAYYNDGNGSASGHVRIYENNSGIWTQVGMDIDGEAVNDRSGNSVSLSSDGNTVAIGARYNNGEAQHAGHVRVFSFDSISVGSVEMYTRTISVYPNPTTGLVYLDLDATDQNLTVNFYNPIGAIIHSAQLSDLSSFSYQLPETKGLYLIQLITEKGEFQRAKVMRE